MIETQIIHLIFGKGIKVWLRDAETGLVLQYGETDNLLVNAAKAVLLQRWFATGGSVRTISKIAVGSGTTAPVVGNTGLETSILAKTITSADQSGEASIPPTRTVSVTFDTSEANGAGTSYIREVGLLFDNNDLVTRALFKQVTITGATQANPVVITSNAHGFANGDTIYIESVGGMTQLNGNHYVVANQAANTFELSGINGTGYGAYTSGGKASKEYIKDNTKVLQVTYPVALTA